jgi:hypothetical protein
VDVAAATMHDKKLPATAAFFASGVRMTERKK